MTLLQNIVSSIKKKIFKKNDAKAIVIILLILIIFPSIYIFPSVRNIERKTLHLKVIEPRLLRLINMTEIAGIFNNTLEMCAIENRNNQIISIDQITLSITFFSEIEKSNDENNICFLSKDKNINYKKLKILNSKFKIDTIKYINDTRFLFDINNIETENELKPFQKLLTQISNKDLYIINNLVITNVPTNRHLNIRPLLIIILLLLLFYYKLEYKEKKLGKLKRN